ncbi:Ger(x)C family spore germination protein [Bacillus sp. V3B]|uniref:Ger(x)C family spore germination protein n=1 Tax=Bacillus sp. V3B TaxID=2804915 RepID=UPI00210ACC81|nr:Ger(x)C family spore germination protein [Bacillus sp. V3B]MCQ6276098.1 Ger(x)C family spore germination protein [Bacillus sp. V3B]
MKKTICLFIIFLFMVVFLSGCWSRKELNELAIAVALGIDKTEDGYLVTVQIINPSELAGQVKSGRTEIVRFTKTGDTVFEAGRMLSTDAPRRIYLAHLRQIIFGEELAREGIGKTLDMLSRHHEMRTDFYITVAKGSTASEILNVQTALEPMPANKLFSALQNSEEIWARTKAVQLDELITSITSKGKEPVLTGIYIYGDPKSGSKFSNVQDVSPESGLRIDEIAVFKQDKLLGWVSSDESKGFNYVTDNVKSTVENIPCEDGKITIATIRSKTDVKGKIENGKPKIDIQVTSEGDIGDVQCKVDLSKPKTIRDLEEKYKNNIKDKMEKAINRAQEDFQSDIFGFGEAIHRGDPKAWRRLEPNWEQEFANLEVSINVKAEIRRLGTVTESFQKEIKE